MTLKTFIFKIKNRVMHPTANIIQLMKGPLGQHISDETYLKWMYKLTMGTSLNLDNPKTFNEKLQYLKLNNRKPEYTQMVDKYEVRKYIAEKLGEEYLIPLLGVWDCADDIDFDQLPNQFVLKCNHNSGLGMVICKDKSKLDIKKARAGLRKGLKQQYYWLGREWPYKTVQPRIVAEQYMVDDATAELRDYKIHCFNGVPCFIQVVSHKTANTTIDIFDFEWNHQEFTRLSRSGKPFPNSSISISAPVNLSSMKTVASTLSKDIPFARVDFYEVNGKLFFGEITFYPASGFGRYTPDEWNYTLGSWIDLSIV